MQLWELNYNGTLVSRYSGLCASIYRVEGNELIQYFTTMQTAVRYISTYNSQLLPSFFFFFFGAGNAIPGGIRSWIATGRRGLYI